MSASVFQNMAPNAKKSFVVTMLFGAAAAGIYMFGGQPAEDALQKARKEHDEEESRLQMVNVNLRGAPENKSRLEKLAADLKPFLENVKKSLGDKVSDVRVSTRLTDSPCCLVAQERALPPSMVRMMRAMKQDVPDEKRILEVNAAHPLVAKLKGMEGAALDDAVAMLYDSALIAEGSPVADGARFAKLLADLMLK